MVGCGFLFRMWLFIIDFLYMNGKEMMTKGTSMMDSEGLIKDSFWALSKDDDFDQDEVLILT